MFLPIISSWARGIAAANCGTGHQAGACQFASVAKSRERSSRLSAVTRVRSCTIAVAARNLSAGSRWARRIVQLRTATSWVSAASRAGVRRNISATHSEGDECALTLPRSARSIASHTLIGDSHSSESDAVSASLTLRPSSSGAATLQIQMCVSRSNLIFSTLPIRLRRQSARRCLLLW